MSEGVVEQVKRLHELALDRKAAIIQKDDEIARLKREMNAGESSMVTKLHDQLESMQKNLDLAQKKITTLEAEQKRLHDVGKDFREFCRLLKQFSH